MLIITFLYHKLGHSFIFNYISSDFFYLNEQLKRLYLYFFNHMYQIVHLIHVKSLGCLNYIFVGLLMCFNLISNLYDSSIVHPVILLLDG